MAKEDWKIVKSLKPTEEAGEYINKGYLREHVTDVDKDGSPKQMLSLELTECDDDGNNIWVKLFVNQANLASLVKAQKEEISAKDAEIAKLKELLAKSS